MKFKKQFTIRKNIFGLEHCVPSDFYKCYHNYQLPKSYDKFVYSLYSNGADNFFKSVLNILFLIVYKYIDF